MSTLKSSMLRAGLKAVISVLSVITCSRELSCICLCVVEASAQKASDADIASKTRANCTVVAQRRRLFLNEFFIFYNPFVSVCLQQTTHLIYLLCVVFVYLLYCCNNITICNLKFS